MPVVVWGNGPDSRTLQRVCNATYIVCDDFVPYPRKRWRRRYYQRISTVAATSYLPHLPVDGSAFAQVIRSSNMLFAVDELVFPLNEGQIANLESAIPLIGSNDQVPYIVDNNITVEWSEVVFAVAGDINHVTASRFFSAVSARNIALANQGRPRAVKIAWEAYHTVSVWGASPYMQMYNELRGIDRGMLIKASQFGLNQDSWLLQTIADSEVYAEQYNAEHYAACSYDPDAVKITADEDAYYEALLQGFPVIGVWMAYSTEESRIAITDAIKRAIRRKWPSGMRDIV